ncbi:outer membrane assembly lipoprotein YfiO [Pseudomonas sp. DC3000-4b1]|uniref:outer membrane assembly lipoprotein YfiO n=1 Tax=unclassified Pseudomonas TaxID=196821 RepID=UPI003CF20C76
MRTRLLTPLALFISTFACTHVQASGDDSCYPDWSPLKRSLDVCNNFPFLSPGNDSRVNLRLLLSDLKVLPLSPNAVAEDERATGYGPVPFPVSRLAEDESLGKPSDDSVTAGLMEQLQQLGVERASLETAGEAFLDGEGSRCRSNTDDSAAAFIAQVAQSPNLANAERQALAQARLKLLEACAWEPQQQATLLPEGLGSPEAEAFAAYLKAAADFYSGRFSEAEAGFTALTGQAQPWLKEVGTYMVARTRLNAAQADVFDEYGGLRQERDAANFAPVSEALTHYLQAYPNGRYAASAKGLVRRVHWLAGDRQALAADYAWQLTEASNEQRSVPLEALIQELDNKLLSPTPDAQGAPLLAAVADLMLLRPDGETPFSAAQLQAQKATFDQHPGLYQYLQAARAFYVDNQPGEALKHLPEAIPEPLDYLAFSQQVLRGLALEAQGDRAAGQALWLKLIAQATAPLQNDLLQLALAMNYERGGELAKVFEANSPVTAEQVRLILLAKVADAPLLRQQAVQGISAKEKATAQFVLLYKDLMRGQYAAFADDLAALGAAPSEEKLDSALGYAYGPAQTLALFNWAGGKGPSGYNCPSLKETAAALQAREHDPKGLNCLGEFIHRNGLDGMPLDQRPEADQLGGTEPAFKGAVYSRLEGYKQVIADPTADRDDKAYALYRAINCYGPSGYNGCGGSEVDQAVRKAWFKQLKGTYASTPWAKAQRYYW